MEIESKDKEKMEEESIKTIGKTFFEEFRLGRRQKIEKGGQFDRKLTFFVYCRQSLQPGPEPGPPAEALNFDIPYRGSKF